MKYLYPNFVIHDSIVGRIRLSFHHRISRILSNRVTRSYSTQKTNILPDHVHLETSCALFPKRLDKTAKPMRNQRRMGKKNGEIWRLKGCGPGKVSHRWWVHVRVFVRLVNVLRSWALAGTSWWTLPSLAPLRRPPPRVVRSRAPCNGGGRETRRKRERSGSVEERVND